MEAELVLDLQMTLGEGPAWDAKRGLLYWVDILSKKVYTYAPTQNEHKVYEMPQYVSAVVPKKQNGLLLFMQDGIYSWENFDSEPQLMQPVEENLANNRSNDGKCDPRGRFFAGTMEMGAKKHAGALYCFDVDGFFSKKIANVTISNGMAWSPDHQTMYFIDTPTQVVKAFDYDLETGEMTNERIALRIPKEEGSPDGMTIDAEGMLWIAYWGGYKVARWNPNTGECIGEVEVPAAQVTSCTFAGDQLTDLYITTARVGLKEKALFEQPYAGGLFRIQTNVKGAPTYAFG